MVDEADFKSLKEALGISDSVLSRHLSALEEMPRQNPQGIRGNASSDLGQAESPAGRIAFTEHVQALKEITGLA